MEGDKGLKHDLKSLLCSDDRDFLVRNNGEQVKVEEHLKKKIVGIYFSAHWCGPCRRFTPKLAETYCEVNAKATEGRAGMEIVFVSGDEDEDGFNEYFQEMPWVAVPFSDSAKRNQLNELFSVQGIPHLVVINGDTGHEIDADAVEVVREYGAHGYPFTSERVNEVKEEEENAKKNQTITSILVSSSRDYVISSNGDKVLVSELEGKVVGIYFSDSQFGSCSDFTSILASMYTELKKRGEPFEVVLASLDDEKESFDEAFQSMPWLALPFGDMICEKLIKYFELGTLPTLVVIGGDGKTLNPNVAEVVEEHGIDAYPFTPEKLQQLAEDEQAKLEEQTLESLLVSDTLDYVLGKDGAKVPVKQLVGKTVLIYFSAHWCPPCRGFTPKLVEVYNEIKAKHSEFEVIFVSSDRDQSSFDEYYSKMPWLALPFGDERKKLLNRIFKVVGIPTLVAINSSGKTTTTETRGLIIEYGSKAFPFTHERLKELEEELEKEADGWLEKVKHKAHEHELVKTRRTSYFCDNCEEEGSGWSFYCADCDFDMHPNCVLGDDAEAEEEEGGGEKGGYICDGEVCRKAI